MLRKQLCRLSRSLVVNLPLILISYLRSQSSLVDSGCAFWSIVPPSRLDLLRGLSFIFDLWLLNFKLWSFNLVIALFVIKTKSGWELICYQVIFKICNKSPASLWNNRNHLLLPTFRGFILSIEVRWILIVFILKICLACHVWIRFFIIWSKFDLIWFLALKSLYWYLQLFNLWKLLLVTLKKRLWLTWFLRIFNILNRLLQTLGLYDNVILFRFLESCWPLLKLTK